MDSSHVLARHIVDTGYGNLPPEVIEVTKRSILDTIGVILAATTLGEKSVKEIVEWIREGGGEGESTLTGGRRKSYYDTLEERRKPQTSSDARYSSFFVLGAAIARGDLLLEDFTARGRENPLALELAQKVTYRLDERYRRPGIEIGAVEIVTKAGARYIKEIPFAYGHPKNPISQQDLHKKFKDCAAHSCKPLTDGTTEKIIQAIERLEEVQDV